MVEMGCCYRNCDGKVILDSSIRFETNIYRFCDENIGAKVLFPLFRGLYPPIFENDSSESDICHKILAQHTSRILESLVKFGIIREIPLPVKIDTEYGFLVSNVNVPYFSGYPYYEILPHPPLI